MNDKILRKSASELEGWQWKDEAPVEGDSSFVEMNFYRLHNVPIKNYDLADLRFMIGQNTALEYLVPIAIEKLKENIFIEAEFYEGDLLCNVFGISDKSNYWANHPKEKQILIDLYENQKHRLKELDLDWDIKRKIKTYYAEFLENNTKKGSPLRFLSKI